MRQRHTLVLTATLCALLVGSCLPSASSPSPSALPASPSALSPSPTVASPSATPVATSVAAKSSPKPVPAVRPSDLVVRHERASDTCCPAAWAVLTADGRYITRTDDNQLHERRLTPAGVQVVRDEIAGTGFFERDQVFPLERLPNANPPGHGLGGLFFRVWRDTRIVEVHTVVDQGPEEVYYQPSAARTRLDRLSKQLIKPETWLPAAAWADAVERPYEPAAFALLLGREPGGYNATPTIDELSATWPFSVGPLALGETMPPTAGPFAETTRCTPLAKDDVPAVKDSIIRAGGSVELQSDGSLVVGFGTKDQQDALVLKLRPFLPDRATCAGEYAL